MSLNLLYRSVGWGATDQIPGARIEPHSDKNLLMGNQNCPTYDEFTEFEGCVELTDGGTILVVQLGKLNLSFFLSVRHGY